MSDTPETDVELAEMFFGFFTMGGLPADAVSVEFARKLERERDVAREVTKNLSVALTAAIRSANVRQEEAEQAMAERDEWKEVAEGSLLGAIKERDALRNELNFTIRLSRTWEDDVERISAERDYWKAEAERWRALSQENVDEVAFDDQTAPYGEWWEVLK